jgi:hypothetical protein
MSERKCVEASDIADATDPDDDAAADFASDPVAATSWPAVRGMGVAVGVGQRLSCGALSGGAGLNENRAPIQGDHARGTAYVGATA